METYIPKIHKEKCHTYVEMLIEAEECPLCKKVMIEKATRGIFPYYVAIDQEAQAKKSDIVFKSQTKVDDSNICENCKSEGKADFLCALCNERKTTDKIQESIGDPAEFLCTDCYESVSAKEWSIAKKELYDSHRYDFE